MELCAEHITIAVTVFNRRDYVLEAISSALDQTVPVKVIVVEDCGPDATLKDLIVSKFGGRIEYFRNLKNRGLFDNWNACIEYCRTPWLSILHDDDLLRPNFIEAMIALSKLAPGRALYHGKNAEILENGRTRSYPPPRWGNWRDVDLMELVDLSILEFAGQIFNTSAAQGLGNFRKMSYYTGDWDMWFRLAVHFGAAESSAETGIVRAHNQRETTLIYRKGWKWALDNVQRKRNIACLSQAKGITVSFDRVKTLKSHPLSLKILLRCAWGFSGRILAYNWWLFIHSRPLRWRYVVTQWLMRVLGPKGLLVFAFPTRLKKPAKKNIS